MVIEVLNLSKCIGKINGMKGIDIMPVVRDGARRVQRRARDLVPVDTGILKGSILKEDLPLQRASEVFTSTEYAPYVEFGTRGHRVEATNAKALRWVGRDGKVHFAKSVYIPPRPPRPFMGRALNEERAGIINNMREYIKKELSNKI